jgi:hypothetical protein
MLNWFAEQLALLAWAAEVTASAPPERDGQALPESEPKTDREIEECNVLITAKESLCTLDVEAAFYNNQKGCNMYATYEMIPYSNISVREMCNSQIAAQRQMDLAECKAVHDYQRAQCYQ